jgi:MYXO-CTERM domain-containing protein
MQDDAAAVYLNGVEVVRSASLPPNAAFNTFATSSSGDNEIWEFAIDPALLLPGNNVFAVEMHQAAANSSDISFDFVLTALVQPVPEPSSVALIAALGASVLLRAFALRRRRLAFPSRGG